MSQTDSTMPDSDRTIMIPDEDDRQLAPARAYGRQRLIDLAVDAVHSPASKRNYGESLNLFFDWLESQPDPALNKALINKFKTHLQSITSERTGKPLSPATINLRLTAVRKMIGEIADNAPGMLNQAQAAAIQKVEGITSGGTRSGNWLTKQQAQALLDAPDPTTKKGLRDRAILAVMLGCALRRNEVSILTLEHIQQREGRWVIVDLVGKRNKVRSVPMPSWVKAALDDWTAAAGITEGNVWRGMRKGDHIIHTPAHMSAQAIWRVVDTYATALGHPNLAPHDLRRTAAKLMLAGGASIEQISLILGHSSIDVTKRYLGIELELQNAATDRIGLKIKRHQKRRSGTV